MSEGFANTRSAASVVIGRWATGLAVAGMLLHPLPVATAGPKGAQPVRGDVEIERAGEDTMIRASDEAIIDYEAFDIARRETVRFVQPGPEARVLNRVLGGEATQIDGSLLANGRVYLLNPSGIFFGNEAIVDVAGLTAAAGTIRNEDFLAGVDRFTEIAGETVNYGTIEGGAVDLIGSRVANHGSIVAPEGTVTLSAGETVYLRPSGSRVMVELDAGGGEPEQDAHAVQNTGSIEAEGGRVSFNAADVYSLAADQRGEVEAAGVAVDGGVGQVNLGGRIEAADGGAGGWVAVTTGGSIDHRGEIVAAGDSGPGGSITLEAGSEYTATSGASADASGATGGSIRITTGRRTLSSGTYTATGASGTGGAIDLGGPGGIGLLGATADASGATGGGRVRLGGPFRGGAGAGGEADPLPTAHKTVISQGSTLSADATGPTGDGGEVIVWSDARTEFYAEASARPGTAAGTGGLIELSSAGHLDLFAADPATSGPDVPAAGDRLLTSRDGQRGGEVLLDPKNITITDAPPDGLALAQRLAHGSILAPPELVVSDNDRFGHALALNGAGDLLAVGAIRDDTDGVRQSGSVYVFGLNSADWSAMPTLRGKLAHGSGLAGGGTLSLSENDFFGSSVALDDGGGVLAVGARRDATGGSARGAVYLFGVDPVDTSEPPVLGQKIADGSTLANGALLLNDLDLFGSSAAVNGPGDVLAVGAARDDTGDVDRGAMYLFEIDPTNLSSPPSLGQKLAHGAPLAGGGMLSLSDRDRFGTAAALNGAGDVLAVGADRDDGIGGTNRGAAYLFGLNASDLTVAPSLGQKLKDGASLAGGGTLSLSDSDRFGAAAALNGAGDLLALGAPGDNTGDGIDPSVRGAAYLFEVDPANLSAAPTLGQKLADESLLTGGGTLQLTDFDRFGTAAALNGPGDILAASSPTADTGGIERGEVHLFELDANDPAAAPALEQKLADGSKLSRGERLSLADDDRFSWSVALNDAGDILSVGAIFDDTGGSLRGAVYLFALDPSDPSAPPALGQKLANGSVLADGGTLELGDSDFFGMSSALNGPGDVLVAGAEGDDTGGPNRGAAYLFEIDPQDLVAPPTLGQKLAHGTQLADGGALGLSDFGLFGTAATLNGAGDVLAVGADGDETDGSRRGATYLFEVDPSNLSAPPTLGQKLAHGSSLAGGGTLTLNENDQFGASVGLNSVGNVLAVAAKEDDTGGSDRGAAYLFGLDPANLAAAPELGQKLADGSTLASGALSLSDSDFFGRSAELNGAGDVLVIGADGDDTGGQNRGAVYLFEVDPTDLSAPPALGQKLAHGSPLGGGETLSLATDDGFGWSAALNDAGDLLAVGAIGDDTGGSNRGAVYLLGLNPMDLSAAPVPGQKLAHGSNLTGALSLTDSDNFGSAAALSGSGEILAVGAAGDDTGGANRGAVYVFELAPADLSAPPILWGKLAHGTQLRGGQTLSLSDFDDFGSAAALNGVGDILAAGASLDDTGGLDRGAAYLFDLDPSDLSMPPALGQKLAHGSDLAGDGTLSLSDDDQFGRAVALNGTGDILSVGAYEDDTGGNNRGAAYLFDLNPSDLSAPPALGQKLASGSALAGGGSLSLLDNVLFGSSAALNGAGDILVVGTEEDDTGGNNRGAAYLFELDPSDLSAAPTRHRKLSDGSDLAGGGTLSLSDGDRFGVSAALNGAGDVLAVGAPFDGADGSNRGAAYLFSIDPSDLSAAPALRKKLADGSPVGAGRTLTLNDPNLFGWSAALNDAGDILAVGAAADDTGGVSRGAVYLFERRAQLGDPTSGFGDDPAVDSFLTPSQITSLLDGGNVTLQANNDITVESAIDAASGAGGDLSLLAGRSVTINADVTLNGAFMATANAPTSAGVIDAQRDLGSAEFTMAEGVTIDTTAAPSAPIELQVADGAGLTNRDAGGLSAERLIAGGSILLDNAGEEGVVGGLGSIFLAEAQSDGPVILRANRSVRVGTITTGGADLTLHADRQDLTGGFARRGDIQVFGSVGSGGGDIVLGGGNDPTTSPARAFGINFDPGVLITGELISGGGDVSIRGEGPAEPGESGAGVVLEDGGTVQSGSGHVTIDGTGQGLSGVVVEGASAGITAQDGQVSITGSLGTLGDQAAGLRISDGATVESTGSAELSLSGHVGTSDGSADVVRGVLIENATVAGRGTGRVSIAGEVPGDAPGPGMAVHSAELIASGGGNLFIEGEGGIGSGLDAENIGVLIDNDPLGSGEDSMIELRGADNTLSITGAGGSGSERDSGVVLDGVELRSGGGDVVTITGDGGGSGGSSSGSALGVTLGASDGSLGGDSSGGATIVHEGDGSVSITGRGGGGDMENIGLALGTDTTIESTGSASIDLDGEGGAGSPGLATDATLRSVDGPIAVQGQSGQTDSVESTAGVLIGSDGLIESTGMAPITVEGEAAPQSFSVRGVSSDGAIRSQQGAVTILGTGRGGFNGEGIAMSFNAEVRSSGAAPLTLVGDAGGITLSGAVVESDGPVNLQGTGSPVLAGVLIDNGAAVRATGSSPLLINGTGGSNGAGQSSTGIRLVGSALVESQGGSGLTLRGTAGASGAAAISVGDATVRETGAAASIHLVGNSMDLAADATVEGTGQLRIRPMDPATSIGLGDGASGTLALDGTELGTLQDGFTRLIFGSPNQAGPIDVRSVDFSDPLLLQAPSLGGRISVAGPVDVTEGSLVLDAEAGIELRNSVRATGSAPDADVLFDDNVTLTGDTTVVGNDVTFDGRIDSDDASTPRRLTVNTFGAGVTAFRGPIGAGPNGVRGGGDDLPLFRLETNADGRVDLGAGVIVLNGESAEFNEPARLTDDLEITELGPGNVVFASTLNSEPNANHGLTVNTEGGGATVFGGSVGVEQPLGAITTDAGGVVQFAAAEIRTSGPQTYGEQAVLMTDVTVAGSQIDFAGGVDRQGHRLNRVTRTAGPTLSELLPGDEGRSEGGRPDEAGRDDADGAGGSAIVEALSAAGVPVPDGLRGYEAQVTLQSHYDTYMLSAGVTEFDPEGFLAFLREGGDRQQALEILADLRELLSEIEAKDLPEAERSRLREELVRHYAPFGLEPEQMQRLLEAYAVSAPG